MLSEFIRAHRGWLLERAHTLRASRGQANHVGDTGQGFALFLDQLIESLEKEQAAGAFTSVDISGPKSGIPSDSKIGSGASSQGMLMFQQGVTIDDLVHSYGDLCQVLVELAQRESLQMEVQEFRMLNQCLDNAIAAAVTEYSFRHDEAISAISAQGHQKQFTAMLEDLRREMGTASTAISALRARELTLGGVTGRILERSVKSLGKILDDLHDSADHRLTPNDVLGQFSLEQFMEQVRALFEPGARLLSRQLLFNAVDPKLGLNGNRDALLAAFNGLLQVMLSRTSVGDAITISAYGRGKRVLIDIAYPNLPDHPGPDDPALVMVRELLQQNKGRLILHNNPNEPGKLTASLPRSTLPT